jgi:hypothetical protein
MLSIRGRGFPFRLGPPFSGVGVIRLRKGKDAAIVANRPFRVCVVYGMVLTIAFALDHRPYHCTDASRAQKKA